MTVRKPLLEWMIDGDPDLTPVVLFDPRATAASYFGTEVRRRGQSASFSLASESPVTPEMILRCRAETGIDFVWAMGGLTPLDLAGLMPDIEIEVREESDADGSVRKQTTVRTPEGELSDAFLTVPDRPGFWSEHLVKGERDLPAMARLIESAARTVLENPEAKALVQRRFAQRAAMMPPDVPLYVSIGVPAFVLTCNLYMASTEAFFLLEDHVSLFERLFAIQAEADAAVLGWAAESGADFVLHAINGLELYSPAIYRKYFIPQAKRHHQRAHELGLRTWVHTCGRMGRLIDMGVYDAMDVDVLESLSHGPLGDVDDLSAARARLGKRVVTRGAVNVNLFYDSDLQSIRERVRYVLGAVRGHRHMIGDANDSFPPYPRDNLLAVVEEMRKSGRMLSPM